MKPGRVILINVLLVVALVILGALGVYLWSQNYDYVSTADASINAPSVPVVATATGTLASLPVHVGEHLKAGQTVATVTVPPSGKSGPTTVTITAPVNGTVAQVQAAQGQMVTPGTPLVTEVQLSQVTVVANIPETKIRRVHVGQSAQVTVDAHPGVTFTATVEHIAPATQSYFSVLPTTATAGSYTKVVQRVPVILSVDTAGYTLLPGENCEVRITIH
ncbi:Multidrug resistance protein (function not yet clear) [Candidatus Hydrogenisulfobacillus filiaventi]|uniref:Multidrug resistance protein (Function not yet clear) n=1 Tax=Candidatus Hydrogenisulfobacillus filiaventi TaxID=2707344 RepID=A0A6F8ZEQ3_9FIRM|nr:Multidrug resistance protein (function not yet clear) [Candidatus Hydrogenisulfobacillus filiaventi]